MTTPAKLIALPESLLAFAEERVAAGEYADVAEVAEEAFRLLVQRHQRRRMLRDELADVLQQMEERAETELPEADAARAPGHSEE